MTEWRLLSPLDAFSWEFLPSPSIIHFLSSDWKKGFQATKKKPV
jgi:hypothetical protein